MSSPKRSDAASSPPKAPAAAKPKVGESPSRSAKDIGAAAAAPKPALAKTPERTDAVRKEEKSLDPPRASAGRKNTPQKSPAAAVGSAAGKPPLGGPSSSEPKPAPADPFSVPPKKATPTRTTASKSPDPTASSPAPGQDEADSAGKSSPKRPSPKPKKAPVGEPKSSPAPAAAPVVMPSPQEIRIMAVSRLLTSVYSKAAPEKIAMVPVIAKEFSGTKEAMLFLQLETKYPAVVAKGFPAMEVKRLEGVIREELEEKVKASQSPPPAAAEAAASEKGSADATAPASPPGKAPKPGLKPSAKPSAKLSGPPSATTSPAAAAAAPVMLSPREARIQAVTKMLVSIYQVHAKEKVPLAASIANEFSGPKEAVLFGQLETKYKLARGFPSAEAARLEKEILAAAAEKIAAEKTVGEKAADEKAASEKIAAEATTATAENISKSLEPQALHNTIAAQQQARDAGPTIAVEVYPTVPTATKGAAGTPPLTPAQATAKAVMIGALTSFYDSRLPAQSPNAAELLTRHEGFENQLFAAMEERHNAPPGTIRSLMMAGAPARAAGSPNSNLFTPQRNGFSDYVEDVWDTVEQSPVAAKHGDGQVKRRRRDYTIREQLQYFCDKYCPNKASTVDTALEVFAGREAELILRLHAKHNVNSSDEYLPDDTVLSANSRDMAAENLPPSLKAAVDFARFYGLGPQYVSKVVLELGSSDPDAVMFELLSVVFPDAVQAAFADEHQLLSHASRRVCEFLSYHNPSKLASVPKYVRHYQGKGLDKAVSDLLLWSYGDLLKRVKLKSFKASDLVPPDEGPSNVSAAAKLESAVRHGEFRKTCERWAQHFGSTSARFSRSTPRELGKLGEMFDAATTTQGLIATLEKDVLTNHREEEIVRILGLREVACETDIKYDSGISYHAARDREARRMLGYEPSLAELRRERHVELYGALPPKPLIDRDPLSGDVYVTNPAIFLDDPACPRCTVLESQLTGALKKLHDMRLDAQVRERLRLFDEIGSTPQPPQPPPLPFNTASHPLPRYLPQSYYPTNVPSPDSSPHRNRQSPHRRGGGGFLDDCESCTELRQQLNYLSQKLHHLRVSRAEELSYGSGGGGGAVGGGHSSSSRAVGGAYTPTHRLGGGGSILDSLTRNSATTAVGSPAGRFVGTMRDEGTMSALSYADISRLEGRTTLEQL